MIEVSLHLKNKPSTWGFVERLGFKMSVSKPIVGIIEQYYVEQDYNAPMPNKRMHLG